MQHMQHPPPRSFHLNAVACSQCASVLAPDEALYAPSGAMVCSSCFQNMQAHTTSKRGTSGAWAIAISTLVAGAATLLLWGIEFYVGACWSLIGFTGTLVATRGLQNAAPSTRSKLAIARAIAMVGLLLWIVGVVQAVAEGTSHSGASTKQRF